jgi:hypothetical protein
MVDDLLKFLVKLASDVRSSAEPDIIYSFELTAAHFFSVVEVQTPGV